MFEKEWATVMTGAEEGLFGWVSVNYLLDALRGPKGTSGVIDLGGGSVQIVYRPDGDVVPPPEYGAQFSLNGWTHSVYQKSHLGFGLDKARDRVAEQVLASAEAGQVALHPCLPAGYMVENVFSGTGSYSKCADLYHTLFDKSECGQPPCSFNGAYQPPMPKDMQLFGFSYLYDRTKAIGLLDGFLEAYGTQSMTTSDIRDAAVSLCNLTPTETKARFEAAEDADKWMNFCGDSTFIVALLEDGFGIHPDANLTMGNKVADVEIVWTLGAMITKVAHLRSLGRLKEEL
jgi:Golgi nucleoside diphosphatase